MRFLRDRVIASKDPESALCHKHLRHLYACFNNEYKAPKLIRDKQISGIQWYFLKFQPSDQYSPELEEDIAYIIDLILRNRRQLNSEILVSIANIPLDTVNDIHKIIHNIFRIVHPFFWTSLFSKWCWINRKVLSVWQWLEEVHVTIYTSKYALLLTL
eukprot:411065_1